MAAPENSESPCAKGLSGPRRRVYYEEERGLTKM